MRTETKTWRFNSENEFNMYALEYITAHVDKLVDQLERFSKEKGRIIKEKIKDYYFLLRCKKVTIEELIDLGISIVKEDVNDWGDFSVDTNSSLKDIALRTILGKRYNFSYVCYTFLYYNKNITEDFIEDMMYVDSPLFRFDEWDDTHVRAVCDCIAAGNKMKEDVVLRKMYSGRPELTDDTIRIKFNLDEYDNISRAFLKKYEKFVKQYKDYCRAL